MYLFDEAEIKADLTVVEPTLDEVNQFRKKKYLGQRKEKLDKLPHDKVIFKLNPDDLACIECGTELKPVGEEFVCTEVEYIPAKLRVIDFFRETYECHRCKNTGSPYMEKAAMPDPVIPHSYSNWILEASKEWLMPVVNLLHRKLLKEKYIHADELCEASHNSSYAQSYVM